VTTTVSPSLGAVYTALGNFILAQLSLAPGQVIQGNQNRVAMPTPANSGFVVMSAINMKRLRTNVDTYPNIGDPTVINHELGTQVDIQIDCYSPLAADWANILVTLLRDDVGCLALAPNCQPLYADDPIRAPLVDAEAQYEDRWIVTARIQYNPITTTGQDFADALGPVDIMVPVDT
jgi:hypothetical protein